jgi:hypothetical protein
VRDGLDNLVSEVVDRMINPGRWEEVSDRKRK